MSVLAHAVSAVSAKGAIGLTVAALALGTAGAEAAITDSANPSNWGQQVVQQVQKCKTALTPGSHGIGECVSTFASKHGQEESSEHPPTPPRAPPPPAPPTDPPPRPPPPPPTA